MAKSSTESWMPRSSIWPRLSASIPPEESSFEVFCWLDDLTSAIARVDLPGGESRHKMSGPAVGQVRR